MTIVSNGRLRLGQDPASPNRSIASEFGGNSGNYQLSDYYAGGSFVPSGTTGINGPIPTAGIIAIDDFYNSSSIKVNVSGQSANAENFKTSAISYFQFGINGVLTKTISSGGGTTTIDVANEWIIGSPILNLENKYQIKFIGNISSELPNYFFPSGVNLNIWYDISSPYIRCGRRQSSIGSSSGGFILQIREKSTGSILEEANLSCVSIVF